MILNFYSVKCLVRWIVGRENGKLGRDVVKTLIISDNQTFHGLIINLFDNQSVSLPWLSRISDTSENHHNHNNQGFRMKGLIINTLSRHTSVSGRTTGAQRREGEESRGNRTGHESVCDYPWQQFGTSMDSKFHHELEKIQNNESGERITFQVEFERNMETKLEGLTVSFREHKTTNKYQIGEITNSLDQPFTEEKERWKTEKSQNTEGHSERSNQWDDTSRYKSETELSGQTSATEGSGNWVAESDSEGKRRDPIFSPTSVIQTEQQRHIQTDGLGHYGKGWCGQGTSHGEILECQVIINLFIPWLSIPFIIRLFVSLPWLSRISDTSENQTDRLDSDNQINISRLICVLDPHGSPFYILCIYHLPKVHMMSVHLRGVLDCHVHVDICRYISLTVKSDRSWGGCR